MTGALRIDKGTSQVQPIQFTFEGETIVGFVGDTIGAALWAAGKKVLRLSPNAGAPRGMFCAMGSCQECVVSVNGVVRTACSTPIAPGLIVNVVSTSRPVAP